MTTTHIVVGVKSEVAALMGCLFAGRLEQPDDGGGDCEASEAAQALAAATGMEPSELAAQVDADRLLELCGGSLQTALLKYMADEAQCRAIAPPKDPMATAATTATAADFAAAVTSALFEPWAVLSNEPGMFALPPAVAATGVTLRELAGGCICCTQAGSPVLRTTLAQMLRARPRPARLFIVLPPDAAPLGVLPMLTEYFAKVSTRVHAHQSASPPTH